MDMAQIAQIALALAAGIGLSASCGFRVFLPPLIVSLASMAGFVNLGDDFAWMGTWQAAVAFGVAAVVEIAAYYIPALDNFLDTISVPLSTIAGLGITAALLGSDISPALRWILAVIAGGGTAIATSTATAGIRAVSTTTTAGLGNGLFSTAEAGTSTLLSVIAIALPILGLVLAILIFVLVRKLIRKIRNRKKAAPAEA
ncbi:MAG: DUF4126 domain-containing protein [Eggerthellaceae bacterium]|nr:DUF4126 domain-containing protein [Eggerthellaceae bacterium]